MKKWISFRLALTLFLGFSILAILFHLLVIMGLVPPDIVWGGRVPNRDELIRMESISLLLLIFMASLVAIKADWIFPPMKKLANYLIWLIPLLFILNTGGNLLALNMMERIIFTPITFLLAVLSLRIALEKH